MLIAEEILDWTKSIIAEEARKVNRERFILLRFDLLSSFVLFFCGWVLLRQYHFRSYIFFVVGLIILMLGLVLPIALRLIYRSCLMLITLAVVFCLILMPVALLAKLFGKKFMKVNFSKKTDSYWEKAKKC
jgi:hypothetical protein